MKTGTGRFRALSAVAAMATLVAAPMPAVAASGGTISFSGAIVAPQLAISAAPAPAQTGARVDATGGQLAQTGSAVTLTFSAPPGVATGADVALQVSNGTTNGTAARDTLAERFVDSGGRVFRAASDGHYRVGRDGGVLSLAPKHAAPDTRVTVVVSYD
ncbi:hypothetical protein [Paraburkholderia caffeinilytica]|uniref:Uncharacterized protein n=1 Tax=Paraburkholderia caffeinilytica TaxID=1761016 RepID=A0ABQ1LBF5_9BURK|nr:hypothetical protein [Paraburkholderia caffeinilytica]GGC21650.1 hypothetical protein GCM10011400_05030 [Paraburkholderia caffeinilytica]CAB3777941.1 hypothetical protein LMG28690_00566 [Paraburkholderia caffeinilytica]